MIDAVNNSDFIETWKLTKERFNIVLVPWSKIKERDLGTDDSINHLFNSLVDCKTWITLPDGTYIFDNWFKHKYDKTKSNKNVGLQKAIHDIEGIDSVIENYFVESCSIKSLEELSGTSVDLLNHYLFSIGADVTQLHSDTLPKQAELAIENPNLFEQYKVKLKRGMSQEAISVKPFLFISDYPLSTRGNRKASFLDCSIWNNYVHLNDSDVDKEKDFDNLHVQLEALNSEYKKYEVRFFCNSALENREHCYRKFSNNHLKQIGSGAHAIHVDPFLFHSETEMKKKCESLLDRIAPYVKKGNVNINIGICDDYSESDITRYKKGVNCKGINKRQIIESNLNSLDHYVLDKITFRFTSYNTIEKLVIRDKTGEHSRLINSDILLLDYLFSNEKVDPNFKEIPEMGTRFFEAIDQNGVRKDEKNEFKIHVDRKHSFLSKLWIIPISSFTSSMLDDLQFQGVTFTDEDIVLSRGADPITQPYLFLYELLFLLYEQLELSLKWFVDFKKDLKKIIAFCKEITELSEEKVENNKATWLNEFTRITAIFKIISDLQNSIIDFPGQSEQKKENRIVQYHSLLSQSILDILRIEKRGEIEIYGHYRDLLYQLSFSSLQDNEAILAILNDLTTACQSYKVSSYD